MAVVVGLRHSVYMVNRRKVITAASLVVVSVAGLAWLLSRQGLDTAEKWVSILGMFVSVSLGSGGVALGWLAFRHARNATTPLPAAPASPRVSASGIGSTAILGDNEGDIDVEISGIRTSPAAPPPVAEGVSASGDAATAIWGNNRKTIKARVTETDQGGRS